LSENNEHLSQDPADGGSLAGVIRFVFNKLLQGVDAMLPARVVSYDRQNNVATVQPLIQVIGTSGRGTGRAILARIPVLALGGGGFVINFPLKPGDLGWIEASDRDISLFVQGLSEAKPNTVRMHAFSDGRFVPDIFRKYSIVDEGDMVIQTTDGQTKVVLRSDSVFVKAPNDITLDSGGTVNIRAGSKIGLQAPQIAIEGNLSMSGGSASIESDTLNIESVTTIEGRPFMGHGHSGVTTGGGNTGGVV
jgi:hypothetical protein